MHFDKMFEFLLSEFFSSTFFDQTFFFVCINKQRKKENSKFLVGGSHTCGKEPWFGRDWGSKGRNRTPAGMVDISECF